MPNKTRNVLATIRANVEGEHVELTLALAEPAWSGNGGELAGELAMALSILFSMRGASPADGALGMRQANAALDYLRRLGIDAAADFGEIPPAKPGTVY